MTDQPLSKSDSTAPSQEFYRIQSALSVVIAGSQLITKKLKSEQGMTPEQIVTMLSTIQRAGWEAARLARLLGLEKHHPMPESGRSDQVGDSSE